MIISLSRVKEFSRKLKKQGKKIVLCGGCFDVLHPGHVIFLERAKRCGDILIVLLESDQKIKKLKGINRPVHNQHQRAQVLSALRSVDYVVVLPNLEEEKDYDLLIMEIRPSVIAATKGSADIHHHQRVAKLVGAKLKYVTRMIGNHSTSRILSSRD